MVLTVAALVSKLEQDLDYRSIPQTYGDVKINGDTTHEKSEEAWRKCRNALTVAARIPLKATQSQQGAIFRKLLQLDQKITFKKSDLPLKNNDKTHVLIVLRRTLIRYAGIVAKDVIEVSPSDVLLIFRTLTLSLRYPRCMRHSICLRQMKCVL